MKILLILFALLTLSPLSAQDKPAYVIFSAKGKKVSYKKMLRDLKKQDVILFGELHDNPIVHWLQLEVSRDLHNNGRLLMGAEMFEADNQNTVNAYLSGEIGTETLQKEARLWSNFKSDYKPLLDFAKDNGLRFIATNVPRRYARQVHQEGFESLQNLSAEELDWIAPLPILFDPDLPRYREILDMMGTHGSPELVKAQAIKDATMAHFILENQEENSIFLHFNGAYHSDFHEGIVWYLKQRKPELKYITISTVEQQDLKKLEQYDLQRADYIIAVQEDIPGTY